ncbi:hypothetical protein L1987_42999 [Smallanthus sonchifolius]|uniref:Uncharacterized protein n=1 Tax=Smallanthus sonchifolius TaxID=185202 RepID=A0ACB9GJV4_9ASTR|nr:hypothetical protein L1987_42999 [Smallanthus sonchifolius]
MIGYVSKTIEKYSEHVKKDENCNQEFDLFTQQQNHQATTIQQKLEHLEASGRKFLGEDIESCSLDEISELGSKLEHTLRTIRARKACLCKELIEKLEAEERCLLEENARLWQQKTSLCQKLVGISPPKYSMKQKDILACRESIQFSEVETDLFLGLKQV